MLKRSVMVLSLVLTVASLAHADATTAIEKQLKKALPDATLDSLQPLADTGWYEGVVDGQILYFSADGAYVLQGDLVDMNTRTNLTEQRRIDLRKEKLANLDEADLIIFEPEGKTDYTLTVFTDIDCGYCRKLHSQIKEYNDLGIRIRYAAFPRGGLQSESYDIAADVWCAKDRQQAITKAKEGQTIEHISCDNPVADEFALGRAMGVTGTPSIFLENGQMLPGYVEPKKLRKILDDNTLDKS